MPKGKQAKILSDAEQTAALTAAHTHSRHPERDRVILLLSFKAGLRAKEIAAVTWDMVTDASGEVGHIIALEGAPHKAGRLGVGHVLYGTGFSHEFSHPAEDRPTWDFGREVA